MEYVNTASNVFYLVAAYVGLQRARALQLPWSFFVAEYALVVVALGSVSFHYTQDWLYEIADELPMSLLAVAYLYTIKELHWLVRGRCARLLFPLMHVATVGGWFVYFSLRNFDVFQALFTAQIAGPALISLAAATSLDCSRKHWLLFLGLIVSGKALWTLERHLWATHSCPASALNPLYWLHAAWHVLSAAAHAAAMVYHKELYLAARALNVVAGGARAGAPKKCASAEDLALLADAFDVEAHS